MDASARGQGQEARDAEERFRRYVHCGMLVHSVCLLTTAGKEAAMIDDFKGAVSCRFFFLSLSPFGVCRSVVFGSFGAVMSVYQAKKIDFP